MTLPTLWHVHELERRSRKQQPLDVADKRSTSLPTYLNRLLGQVQLIRVNVFILIVVSLFFGV